ncbi:MAG: DNA helicase, partial [Gluconobacter potus]
FRTRPLALLGLLHALHNKTPIRPTAPGRVSLPWSEIHGQFGWIRAGDTGLRLDIAERCIVEMHQLTVRHDHAAPLSLASRLGAKADMLPSILKGLGIAHQPAEAPSSAHAGPPRPLMILNDRKTRASRRCRSAPHHTPPRRPAPPRTDSPFAALAALREKIRP